MYRDRIRSNKRRALGYLAGFTTFWLATGGIVGWMAATAAGPSPDTRTGLADVGSGLLIGALLAMTGMAFTFVCGSAFILGRAGAVPADRRRHARLHAMVHRLARQDDLPVPEVYVVEQRALNAFATGTDPQHSAIAVTTGLLAGLDDEELEAVLAHELSHINNHDTRLLLVLTTLGVGFTGALAFLVHAARVIFRRARRSSRPGRAADGELVADRCGVALTHNPNGLVRALRTVNGSREPLGRGSLATSAMCIDSPLRHRHPTAWRQFTVRPSIEQRIESLQQPATDTVAA